MTLAAMIETVTANDVVLALVVRAGFRPGETTFVTPDTANLQVGFVVYGAGKSIARHYHVPVERRVVGTNEVVLVRAGRCTVELYDDQQRPAASVVLEAGDLIAFQAGGHGFHCHEDCVLLEIKQGPYQGRAEKVLF